MGRRGRILGTSQRTESLPGALEGDAPFSVAVVIPTFNRASFLGDALRSVFAQTVAPREVIVVDDGSDDDPGSIVADFSRARLLRQANAGPSAARNAGIAAAASHYVMCLDSDDVLLPTAIESSLACFAENPDVAFVYGAHQRVDEALAPIGAPYFAPMARHAYHDLLRNNHIHMLGTVMFNRAKLVQPGGFDTGISRSEDYELFLRLARQHPIADHPALVAQYRIHRANLSARPAEMAASALAAQERHRPAEADLAGQRAYAEGKRILARTYAVSAWRSDPSAPSAPKWKDRLEMARIAPFSSLGASMWQFARRHLPPSATNLVKTLLGRGAPALGRVQMGDLARKRPISWHHGYDRGTPIDRYYIENFLERHAADIRGRVLEVGDDGYSRRFGSGIAHQDVLHIDPRAPGATITGDLSRSGLLPTEAFDGMIVTQTLQFIYDVAAPVRELYCGLKPGGVLLVTLPGIASIDRGEFANSCFWSMTAKSVERLFGDVFGRSNVSIRVHGNVYAATCFLQGLALEEINEGWLDSFDASYPVIVTVRARRAD